jgi:putative spermidine/putrescine transport system substrate-binding protein
MIRIGPAMKSRILTRRSMVKGGTVLAGALLTGVAARARAAQRFEGRTVVFSSYGGSYQQNEKTCYCDPFTEKTGAKVLQDGPMDEAKFRVMVESGHPTWDVAEAALNFLYSGAKQNLFQKLDMSRIDVSRIDPRFVTEYGVGNVATSYNIAYNTKLIAPGEHPKSWADVFDLKKFPGPRSLMNKVVPMMEIALLADGVAMEKLYPIDAARAFKRLDTIKQNVVWWDTFSQSQQLIVDGQASCGVMNSGRVFDSFKKGASVAVEWNQNIQNGGFWVILRGSENVDVAHGLINEMAVAANQAKMADLNAYSPTNLDALALVNPDVRSWLPLDPANAKLGVLINGGFWAEHQSELNDRWNEWKLS